jgi:hypothetical protein
MSLLQGFVQGHARVPATHLHLTRWDDPAVETKRFADPLGITWLSILGPSAKALLSVLQVFVDDDRGVRPIELDLLSQMLGLGTCDSKHAPILRAIARLVHFGLAKRMAAGQLAVRCHVGPPSPQQLRGLCPPLQIAYRESNATSAGANPRTD